MVFSLNECYFATNKFHYVFMIVKKIFEINLLIKLYTCSLLKQDFIEYAYDGLEDSTQEIGYQWLQLAIKRICYSWLFHCFFKYHILRV